MAGGEKEAKQSLLPPSKAPTYTVPVVPAPRRLQLAPLPPVVPSSAPLAPLPPTVASTSLVAPAPPIALPSFDEVDAAVRCV